MKSIGSVVLAAALGAISVGEPSVAQGKSGERAMTRHHGHHSALQRPDHRHSGPSHVQRGTASVYASNLSGRRMADGSRFDPSSNTAASKTLALGTTARVTNLHSGKTATVQVRDRGPYRAGRIIDVSPSTAGTLGMGRKGTAPVAVAPITPGPGS
jgi:rare lipoprotein A